MNGFELKRALGLEGTTVKLLSAFVFGMVICLCGQAFAQNGYFGHQQYYGFQDSKWEYNIGMKVLSIGADDSTSPLVQDVVLGTTLFTVGDLSNIGTGVGIDGSLQCNMSNGTSCEIRSYFAQWNSNVLFVDPAGDLTTIFNGLNDIEVTIPEGGNSGESLPPYQTQIFNIELNYKQAVASGVSFVCGPRFVFIDDSFGVRAEALTPGGTTVTGNGFTLNNRLYGGQAGFDLRLPLSNRCFISSNFRGGAFANPLRFRTSTFVEIPPTAAVITEATVEETVFSYMGELAVRANWDIITGSVAGYVGYEATWFGQVGRAYGQLINTSTDIATDTLFFQGIVFGCTYRR